MNFQFALRAMVMCGMCLTLGASWATCLRADWPAILGPNRNGIADAESSLPEHLPGELKPIWKVTAGQGYAGPAIAGNEIVLFERVGENDRARMLDTSTGKEIWSRDLKARYRGGIDSDKGPRCVPSITSTSILLYSAAGDLTLLSRKDGTVLWTRPLRTEYEAEDGYFGAGSSPLIVGEEAVVNVGGKLGSIVCLSLVDGKTRWTAGVGEASYASPIAVPATRNPSSSVVVVPTRLITYGLEMESGKTLWQFPFGKRGPTVNAATPVRLENGDLYMTASYDIGSLTVRPDVSSASVIRKGTELSSQYASPVAVGGLIFGCDGREDGGNGIYKCVRQNDGKVLWEEPNMPICHTIGVGEKLLVVGIDGKIWGLSQKSARFEPLWQTSFPKGVYRALPAFSGNNLFVRSSGGGDDCWYCFELK